MRCTGLTCFRRSQRPKGGGGVGQGEILDMSRNWMVASVLGLGLVASAGAQAQTAGGFLLPSVTGGTSGSGLISFTFDGFAVSIDQCALKTNGTAQSSCA